MAISKFNISIKNVKNILMEKANDLWGLCNTDRINAWSKYKPVIWLGVPDRTNDLWCASQKGNYGINIGGRNNLDPSGRDLSVKKWVYERPKDGTNSPARLGDFGGYNHDAKPPIYIHSDSELKVHPYNYKFTIPLSTGDIPLSLIDLSSVGWDRDKLRLMAVDTLSGVRYHCTTKLKDMTQTADYEFENQNTALTPAQNYNFRLFIAQYANDSIYSATGDGTTIFNDNVFTQTDQVVRCKSMADIEAENPTNTYARYIETRNVYYKTNTVEWKSVDLSSSIDDPAQAVPFVDINNFDPYRRELIFKLKFNTPDNVFNANTFNNTSLRTVTPMLNYSGEVGFNKQYFAGGRMKLYKSFNKLTGSLTDEWTDAMGYIPRGTVLYCVIPSRVYQSDLSPNNVKAVRTSVGVFFRNSETVCRATFYVKSDSQAQTLPTPSWTN